ncbi:MAG: penicillin-binding protein activator [Candidatus Thiodiazotropha taylori]|nr:penicillin-binding protein activator [Candidatus Thiodiazotropha taylori]
MNIKKNWILISLIVVISVVGFTSWFLSKSDDHANEQTRIGVVLPLTGDLANFGKTVLNGIQLALDDYVQENPSLEIKLLPEDSQAKPAVAVSALQKLIDANGVQIIIGSLTSSATLAMAPIAQQRQILLISPTASNPKLSDAGPFFIRVWPSDSFDGAIAAEYCYNNLGLRKAGVVNLNNDYGLGLKQVFTSTFKRLGGEVSFSDSYLEDATDFRTLLTKANHQDLDVLYLPGHPQGIGTILKQARELGVSMTFISNVAAEDKEFLSVAGNAAQGLFFTAPAFSIETGGPAMKRFVQEYKRRFNDTPDVHAVKGFEAMTVLLEAIGNNYRSPNEIKDFLLVGRSFDVLSGNIQFDANGDVITAMAVKQYDDTGDVLLREIWSPTEVR